MDVLDYVSYEGIEKVLMHFKKWGSQKLMTGLKVSITAGLQLLLSPKIFKREASNADAFKYLNFLLALWHNNLYSMR